MAVVLLVSSVGLVAGLTHGKSFSWSGGLGIKVDTLLKGWFGLVASGSGVVADKDATFHSESKSEVDINVNVTLRPTVRVTLRPKLRPSTIPIPCYRYRITNLDGSTRSNKCYPKTVYDQIWGAVTDASSARTFIKFHEDGYTQYMDLYRKDGKSLWLDAANSQKAGIDSEQAKLSAALARISALEAQGR